VPTLGNVNNIKNLFIGLKNQDYKNFEVLIVTLKPINKIQKIIKRFRKHFKIRLIFQKNKGIMQAYELGFRNAKGEFIITTDDDAIPNSDWILQHVSTYEKFDVSGVSGEVIPAYLHNGHLIPLPRSDITFYSKQNKTFQMLANKTWNRPLLGLENYLFYISKSGYTQINRNVDPTKIVNSLLIKSVNMSLKRCAIKDVFIPKNYLKRGLSWEQALSWHLRKMGHQMVYNQRVKVHHILHGETMSRFIHVKNVPNSWMERELLFYFLMLQKENVSVTCRILDLFFQFCIFIKDLDSNPRYNLSRLKAIIKGNLKGIKWLISNAFGGQYRPINN
jgi:glycosyltransferase involved in cell wall biosynthesis